MVQQYKLYYFDIPGLAEPIRMLFHYAGQPFEDVRFDKEKDWPTQKTKFIYQQVPVLEFDDGKQLAQSTTILRFLGKRFALAGKDEYEEAKASEITDLIKDFTGDARPYARVKMGQVQGDLEHLRKVIWVPAMDKFLPLFVKLLAASGSGFLLPSGISYVDFLVSNLMERIMEMDKKDLLEYPKLVEYVDRVNGQPQLKEYMMNKRKK